MGVTPATPWLRRLATPVAILAIAAVAVDGATLFLARTIDLRGPRPMIFPYLFASDEPAAAWLGCAVIGIAVIVSARVQRIDGETLIAGLSANPLPFALAMALVLTVSALLVYRAHPLSMDEYAPVFQAGAFAHLRLAGRVPPELLPRLLPQADAWFIESRPDGQLISTYWPGFALLLTPFTWIHAPWLLNPLVGAATLLALARLSRLLWPGTHAAGWAVLFAAASPALTVNAISFYSMPAHLLASLVFAILVLEERLFAAGVVGSLALVLHNPLPHLLFASPWIVWLALRTGRGASLTRLAAGYLPLSLLLGVGWFLFRATFHPMAGSAVPTSGKFHEVLQAAFSLPSLSLFRNRGLNLAELFQWAVPALVPLACAGAWQRRAEIGPRLLALSAITTLAGYFFVPFDQGHGWGFRYFHSAWGVLPLLAAGALNGAAPPLRRFMLVAAVMSLLCGTALRFAQVRRFMDAQLAQIPEPDRPALLEVVMVHVNTGYYTIDLVQDVPFLDNARWILMSRGPADDAQFVPAHFPGARLAAENRTASVWQIQ